MVVSSRDLVEWLTDLVQGHDDLKGDKKLLSMKRLTRPNHTHTHSSKSESEVKNGHVITLTKPIKGYLTRRN